MRKSKRERADRDGVSRRRFFNSVAAGAAEATILTTTGTAAAQPPRQAVDNNMARTVLNINGRTHELSVEPRWTLQYVLRDRLGLMGTKSACERGECGACTVLIDGVARYACMTLAVEAAGALITTIEGLMHGEEPEELGVPLDRIQIEHADTGTTEFTRPSGGSKTVFADSPAVRAAALEVKSQVLEMAAAQLKVPATDLDFQDGAVVVKSDAKKVPLREINALRTQQVVVGVGQRGPDPTEKAVRPFVAHFAEVEVNIRTGEMRVLRMVAAHDSGRVMDQLTYNNQVMGGVIQGIGFAMTERRIMDAVTGKMANATWHDYKIPTAKDVPADMMVVPIDLHDTECNTTGTKGIGEPATIPTAAAIANAFYHATGLRITAAPITPGKILAMLEQRNKRG